VAAHRTWRLAFTVLAAVALYATRWVPLPIELLEPYRTILRDDPSVVSAFAITLAPWTSAAIVVELVAALVPRWRALRLSGPDGRARLWRATVIVGLLLLVTQSFFMSRWLSKTGAVTPSTNTTIVVIATLTAGSTLVLLLAFAISRFGLGNGLSIVLVTTLLPELAGALGGWPTLKAASSPELVRLGLEGAAAVAFAALVLYRGAGRAPPGRAIPFPASGTQPLAAALAVPPFVASVSQFSPAFVPLAQALAEPSLGTLSIQAGIVAFTALALTWAFNRPTWLAANWRRPGEEGAERDVSGAILGAAARATLFLLLLGAAQIAATATHLSVNVTASLSLSAVALDLIGEWRASAAGRLIPVWPLARPYAVDAAVTALREAGIPAFPRALHHRAVLQAFGPFLTIDLLVLEAQVQEARRILEARA
jgi:SecY/Putative prokaryotic signal transducing protein